MTDNAALPLTPCPTCGGDTIATGDDCGKKGCGCRMKYLAVAARQPDTAARCPVCGNVGPNRTCHPAQDAVSRRNLPDDDPRRVPESEAGRFLPLTPEDIAEFDHWAETRRGKGASRGMIWALRLRATLREIAVDVALAATATPDPAAPDLRSSAAWLVQRWDGNRTVEPDALRADIAVLRSALRGPWNNPHQLAPTPDPAAVAYDLDAAWAEAEAALPEGWWFSALSRGHDGYAAKAHDGTVIDGRVASLRRGYGPTPAAALRAIAARLREGTR